MGIPRTAGIFSLCSYLAHTDRAIAALYRCFFQRMRVPLPILIAGLLILQTFSAKAQVPIGQWRDHFSFLGTRNVIEGGDGAIYCTTKNGLFRLNLADHSTEKYTKVNALSDVDLTSISWNHALGALLIGYGNGNVDMIQGGSATNLSDIKRSSILGDKGVYYFLNDGTNVLLACGFGIVKYDLVNKEVRDTWFIGPNATPIRVNAIAFHNDSIYAGTDVGLFSAWRNDPNLASFTQWHKRTDLPTPNGPINAVASFAGRLVVNYHVEASNDRDTVYWQDGATWQRFTDSYGYRNGSLEVSADGQRLVVAHNRQVSQYNTEMNRFFHSAFILGIGFGCSTAAARSAGGVWVATQDRGLGLLNESPEDGEIYPNGPRNASAWRLSAVNGAVYASTGAVAGNYSSIFRKDGVHSFVDGSWRTNDQFTDPLIQTGANNYGGTTNDVITIAVDPDDPDHAFAGSWDEGVIEFRGRQAVTIYNGNNSSLQPFSQTGTDAQVQVAGMDYDESGNLWVTNSNCDSPINVRKKDGTWVSIAPGSVLSNNSVMADILAASNGFKWIIRPRGNGMIVMNDGGTIEDTGDDQYQLINTFDGQGELPSVDVYSMAEDKDGQIWLGTGKGVAVFYNPNAMFTGEDFDSQQILIEQDGNVQILLETENVSAIVVDGANRKWIGTQSSGVFLVSPDGTEQIQHFTVENSPLPSNNIICLAIEPGTGEVFMGTDAGIISYRGDATEGENSASCASVFPNPVKPTYSGPVAITGLVQNSDVRIMDIAGNLVYHTTSLGGQAMWPATDMSGNRVSTGVYLILASDPTGESTCNTKVLVTR